jgi:signal transduction histidine kinase
MFYATGRQETTACASEWDTAAGLVGSAHRLVASDQTLRSPAELPREIIVFSAGEVFARIVHEAPTDQPMSRRILIAENDNHDIGCVQRCVATSVDKVVLATCASDVVDVFVPGRFDLVVLSMDLPGLDPLFLLEGIRSADAEVPVFLIGGDCGRRSQAVGWGASAVLAKPIDEAALSAWVATVFELRRARIDVTCKTDDLSRVQKERREVLASLVHDLNNPLAIVQGNVQWSREHVEPGQADLADALDDAIEGVRRMRVMVETLLMVSQLDSGQIALRRQRVGMMALVDDAVKAHAGRAREKNISLSMNSEGVADVDGDPQVLRHVMDSLIENSMRNTPASGQIRLSVRSSSGVEIRVANSGAPAADSAATRVNLDLYFCRRAIEAHDGALELAQTDQQERELVVRLPGTEAR